MLGLCEINWMPHLQSLPSVSPPRVDCRMIRRVLIVVLRSTLSCA